MDGFRKKLVTDVHTVLQTEFIRLHLKWVKQNAVIYECRSHVLLH